MTTTSPPTNGGNAFPQSESSLGNPMDAEHKDCGGMALRQYAAIKLSVADSGDEWLDKMITESNRARFAGMVLEGTVSNSHVAVMKPSEYAVDAYLVADAMIARPGESRKDGR